MKLKLLLLSMICCIVTFTPVMATTFPTTSIPSESVSPSSEVLEWRYKIEDGKLYKRLYNTTTANWGAIGFM